MSDTSVVEATLAAVEEQSPRSEVQGPKLEMEQKEAKEAKEQEVGGTEVQQTVAPDIAQGEREEGTLTPAVSQGEKEKAVERVRAAEGLPAGMRERLAGVVEASADEGGKIGIEECLRAIEESLPDFLRQDRARAMRQEHPAGEVFFRGDAEEVTDGEAEEVARRQLERSGLLRGQRVRVAD